MVSSRGFSKKIQKIMIGGVLLVMSISLFGNSALAIDEAMFQSFSQNNITMYDPNICANPTSSATSASGTTGSWTDPSTPAGKNAQTLFNFLIDQGFSGIMAAGVIGNAAVENTQFDPTVMGGGGGSYAGIFQWSSSRFGSTGKTLDAQMNLMMTELHGSYKSTLTNLISAGSEGQASDVWLVLYEGAVGSSNGNGQPTLYKVGNVAAGTIYQAAATRRNNATMVLGSFKYTGSDTTKSGKVAKDIQADTTKLGATASGGTTSATASGNACTSASTGGNFTTASVSASGKHPTTTINGLAIFSQFDPQWASSSFGSSTISSSGCGPSSMAMIVSNLTGTLVTPDEIGKNFGNQYVPGAGASHSLPAAVAKQYNLTVATLNVSDSNIVDEINQAIQAGKYVETVGNSGYGPYSQGGHFVAIRAIQNGQWVLFDSGPGPAKAQTANTTPYDPQVMLKGIRADGAGVVWVISK